MDFEHVHRATYRDGLRKANPEQPALGVWSLQRALNQVSESADIAEDGIFGPRTHEVLQRYQRNRGLEPDGIAGYQTQKRILSGWINDVQSREKLPPGALTGIVAGEAGWNLSAVNWSVEGGVDGGGVQRRIYVRSGWSKGQPWPGYQASFDPEKVQDAFNSRLQVYRLGDDLADLHEDFRIGDGVMVAGKLADYRPLNHIKGIDERAWRLALLHHNYPVAAIKMADGDELSAYWHTAAAWVPDFARFKDGTQVRTPYEWCCYYALGAPQHDHAGVMASQVTDWTP